MTADGGAPLNDIALSTDDRPVTPPELPAVPKARRTGLLVSLLVLAILGAGTGLGLGAVALHGRDNSRHTSTASQASPSPSPSPSSTLRDVNTFARSTDPKPLSVKEAFPTTPILTALGRYRVVKTQLTTCGRALEPAKIITAAMGCTQAVRATVTSSNGKWVCTIGVLNLVNKPAAQQLSGIMDKKKADVLPMPVPGTAASDFTQSNATWWMRWTPEGHYLAYTLCARIGGESTTTRSTELDSVIDDLQDWILLVEFHRRYTQY